MGGPDVCGALSPKANASGRAARDRIVAMLTKLERQR